MRDPIRKWLRLSCGLDCATVISWWQRQLMEVHDSAGVSYLLLDFPRSRKSHIQTRWQIVSESFCRSLNLQRPSQVSVWPQWVGRSPHLLLEVTHKFTSNVCQPSKVSPESLIPPFVTSESLLPAPFWILHWPPFGLPQLRHCLLALEGTGSGWSLSRGWAT